jgi:hypothetical protein
MGKTSIVSVGSASHRTPIAKSLTSSNKVTPDQGHRSRPNWALAKAAENNTNSCSLSVAPIEPRVGTKNLSTVGLFNQLFNGLPLERKSFELNGAGRNECPILHSKSNPIKPSKSSEDGMSLPMRISIKESDVIDNNTVENNAVDYNAVENCASGVAYDMDFSPTSNEEIDDWVCTNDGICDNSLSSIHGVMHSLLPIQALFPVQRHNQSTFIYPAPRIIHNKYILSPQRLSILLIFPIPETMRTFTMESLKRVKSFAEWAPKGRKVETTLVN